MSSAARFATTTSKVDGTFAVAIRADTKRAAQGAIKLARAWVNSLGGISRLTSFTVGPRYSSNLDQVFAARVAYRIPAVAP